MLQWHAISPIQRQKATGHALHGTATVMRAAGAKRQVSEAHIRELAEQCTTPRLHHPNIHILFPLATGNVAA